MFHNYTQRSLLGHDEFVINYKCVIIKSVVLVVNLILLTEMMK